MGWFLDAILQALKMIVSLEAELYGIIWLSLLVSLSAVVISGVLGIPVGVGLAMVNFRGKGFIINLFNTMMGLPPVVVGLITFILLSRQGLFGSAQLLFTPMAMVIAQSLLVFPIVAALSHGAVVGLHPLLPDSARTLGASRIQVAFLVIHEARFGIVAALIAGFGRAIAEVGAVLMVGGNIKGATRTMTTAIAMQTSMGQYDMALALGLVLIILAFAVNAVFYRIQRGRI